MSEKIKTEHNDEVRFDAGWSGMAESISSADVKKAEKPRLSQRVLGKVALKMAREGATEGEVERGERLDEDEIAAIIAAEEGGKTVEIGEDTEAAEALEKAFEEPDKYVREVMGEELSRAEVEALRLAREQPAGAYFGFVGDTAAIHGLLPENLLHVVRKDVKDLMYDQERRDTVMFAMEVGEQDFEQLLRTGRLERAEGEYDATISNLQLKEYAETEDGEDGVGELKAGKVRLFFDGRLVDEESFDCLLKDPIVDEVRLEQCVGVMVKGGAEEAEKWTKQLRGREVALPVQNEELMNGAALSLKLFGTLREQEERYLEGQREERRLEREALTDVDQDKVVETVRQYTDRLSDEMMDRIFAAYQGSKTSEDFHAAAELTSGKICEAFGIQEKPKLKYVNVPGTKEKPAMLSRMYYDSEAGVRVIEINERYQKLGDASANIDAIGRESFRVVQEELCKKAEAGGLDSLSEGEQERVKIYQWNQAHPIPPVVDYASYLMQANEGEAWEAGAQCRDKLFEAFERSQAVAKDKTAFPWTRHQRRLKEKVAREYSTEKLKRGA